MMREGFSTLLRESEAERLDGAGERGANITRLGPLERRDMPLAGGARSLSHTGMGRHYNSSQGAEDAARVRLRAVARPVRQAAGVGNDAGGNWRG